MRWLYLFSILVAAFVSGCRGGSGQEDRDRIELGQKVTVNNKPVDPVFKDFPQRWRQFISKSPELSIPVMGVVKQQPTPPEPVIFNECVFSPDAHGYVPQVTITWDEPSGQITEIPKVAIVAQQRQEETPVVRFDLGLHHDPFGRNFYSSALSTDKQKRFTLPANSALANNQEAVLLTGPGLFPKLMDYKAFTVRDPKTNRAFLKQTVVLRELSEGITSTLRVSYLAGKEWNTDQQFVFQAPVCPVAF
jgi:hypothetical protein